MKTRVRVLIDNGWKNATLTDEHVCSTYGQLVAVIDGEKSPREYDGVYLVECFDEEALEAAIRAGFAIGA